MSILDKKLLPHNLFVSRKKKIETQVKATGIHMSEPPMIDKNNKLFFYSGQCDDKLSGCHRYSRLLYESL